MAYLPAFWVVFGVNVGTVNIPYMDHLGLSSQCSKQNRQVQDVKAPAIALPVDYSEALGLK